MTISSLEDFEKLYLKVGNRDEEMITKGKKLFEEVSKFYDCYIEVSHKENYVELVNVYLKNDFLKLRISENRFPKKFAIYCDEIHRFKNVTTYIITSCKDKVGEPNKIGVLSTKKLQEWIEFWEKVYNRVSEIDKKNQQEKDVFIESLKNYHIKWSYDKKSGQISLNGIVLQFWLDVTYVRKTISLEYNLGSDLSTFIKLSNNKLNAF